MITSKQLYERLRALADVDSDEALARELEIPLRSLTRLKAGKGAQFDRTVYLLSRAGLLSQEAEDAAMAASATSTGQRPESAAAALVALATKVDEGLQDVRERLDALENRPSGTARRTQPRRRRAS